ncbi:MAG: hypothetical protein SAL70_44595, partial [Scytonema sp. PMC 1070.18]|nr:hypothetical protein [Scytonema sp. PMC 1070.18]
IAPLTVHLFLSYLCPRAPSTSPIRDRTPYGSLVSLIPLPTCSQYFPNSRSHPLRFTCFSHTSAHVLPILPQFAIALLPPERLRKKSLNPIHPLGDKQVSPSNYGGVLGDNSSPSKLLGDKEVSPSHQEVLSKKSLNPIHPLGDKQVSPSKNEEVLGDKSPSNLPLDKQVSPSKNEELSDLDPSNDISPSKLRRHKGLGSGSIHWRTITKNGKDYPQAYYHYEFWQDGDRLIKTTKYIPKSLLPKILELEARKACVREILKLLGVWDNAFL